MMNLNVEYNRDDALLYYSIAEIHLMRGDRANAIVNMQKTVDMDSDGRWAAFIEDQIEKLKAAGEGAAPAGGGSGG